ncbi:hypothetical protein FE257_008266 [Aspergillus nanangensis]|uniref:FAD dependent oxidoreductase domain-containing protein n=1 Tax=Aspergillus nanangensis TaxID=2582783 RepID=A0AAD4GTR0_ASPNN|nr:hypothetical protein FE257_008266 [Aspergillus nanangensis]
MPKVTILGAGQLPKDYEVTIVGRNLPGDADSLEWASPWAGAIWMPVQGSKEDDQKIQLDALAYLTRLAVSHPESSIRRIEMEEILDFEPDEDVWFRWKLPGFAELPKAKLPPKAKYGMKCTDNACPLQTVVMQPQVLIEFLRKKLEACGVKFLRFTVQSLSDLKALGHDVLINASALGALKLKDVKADPAIEPVLSQIILVKSEYNKIFMRHDKDYSVAYTYILPRLDGTAILGGIRNYGATKAEITDEVKHGIYKRLHENLPDVFPEDTSKVEHVRDIVGLQPQREAGVKIHSEVLDGQNVVHAFGLRGGGYILSFGLAREVVRLVNEFQFQFPASAKL